MISRITQAFQYRLDIARCGGVYLDVTKLYTNSVCRTKGDKISFLFTCISLNNKKNFKLPFYLNLQKHKVWLEIRII